MDRYETLAEDLVEPFVPNIPIGRGHKVASILLDFRQILLQINLMRALELGFLEDLPSNEQDWKDEDHHVSETGVSRGLLDDVEIDVPQKLR
jgi:hypothetical protein